MQIAENITEPDTYLHDFLLGQIVFLCISAEGETFDIFPHCHSHRVAFKCGDMLRQAVMVEVV